MSFARLVNRFKEGLGNGGEALSSVHHDPLPLATAAILLEIAYADGTFTPSEGEDLTSYLQRAFTLAAEEAKELLDAAAEIRNRTIDHFALTNFIRKNAPLHARVDIVKTMWRMVYSDGKLSDYENYLVRKLADLLGLEHHVMIDAKVAVLRDMGLAAR
ncbi:MAG TPA: TerB family tellurite resistance protein [Thermoanaerobaculia bacterium]|nr:TerB family tellurite resistance protein [Thermoanaerobaculia bacterium]